MCIRDSGCHGNSLSSLENLNSILEFADHYNPVIHSKNSQYLVRNWNQCNFGLFLPNLVAMATVLAPLKNQIAYLHSTTPITMLFTQKDSWYLVQNWNQCSFGLFLPKFACYGNSLCSLENSNSIFEFDNPENPTLHAKSVSISCTEVK